MTKNDLWLILFMMSFQVCVHAQICTGNLGENIFTAGDFGSGTANIPSVNPNIAPGYTYTTNPPPPDGQYTLTNNTGVWSMLYGDWLKVQDNSNDPNGYMMVVNASFTPGLFYEQEVSGLCENTLYEFSADVLNLVKNGRNLIKPNVSFLVNDEIVISTGNIPENEQWITFGFTFTTEPDETTIKLSLQNNAPGGIGNDLCIDNIRFRPCGPEALILPTEIANICVDGDPIELFATVNGDQYEDASFQWQQSFDEGETWQNMTGANSNSIIHGQLVSGFYYYRYLLANGSSNLDNSKCRVVSNVKIVQVVPKFFDIQDTICQGLNYIVGDSQYGTAGMYTDSLISSLGCDSIVNLELSIVPNDEIEANLTIIDPSCSYLEDGSIQLTDITNGFSPYIYMVNDESLPAGNKFNLSEGSFQYVITDKYGCVYDTTLVLITPNPFMIELGSDYEIELGETIDVVPTANDDVNNFSWYSPETVLCTSCWELNWQPFNDTYLSIKAESEFGCEDTDTIQVRVFKDRNIYIPNSFSPNNDGKNDRFEIFAKGPNIKQIDRMQIFDRWGNLVFDRKNIAYNDDNVQWDGTQDGRKLISGTYAYLIEIQFLDNVTLQYTGSLNLLR